jgi:hypothetical protein
MALPANYRPAPGKEKCGNCLFLNGARFCGKWKANVDLGYYCDSYIQDHKIVIRRDNSLKHTGRND